MALATASLTRKDVLPVGLPPRLLSRVRAAAYLGLSPATFDQWVYDRIMPRPIRHRGRVLWDRRKIDHAIDALDKDEDDDNPYRRMSL